MAKPRKRKLATPAELRQAKEEFWRGSALFSLRRAAATVRKGERIPVADRDYISALLEDLADKEKIRIQSMSRTKLRAYLADYLQGTLRITLHQAARAVVTGEDAAEEEAIPAVLKALTRLRKDRRLRQKKKPGHKR